MSDREARDAYVAVEIETPNGSIIQGKPIPWEEGMRIKTLLLDFLIEPSEKNRARAFDAFSVASGVTAEMLKAADPYITIGEMVDFINRFTHLLRPGRTAAGEMPARIASPSPSPSPSISLTP